MGKQVLVRSIDVSENLPTTALYTVGATVTLTDAQYASIPEEYVRQNLTLVDDNLPDPVVGDPEVGGGGTGAPLAESTLTARLAGTITLGVSAPVAFTNPPDAQVGNDLALDDDGNLVINTSGLYSIAYQINVVGTGNGHAYFFVGDGGGTTPPDSSFLNWGMGYLYPPSGVMTILALPPTRLAAGNVVALQFNGADVGVVDEIPDCTLFATRLA